MRSQRSGRGSGSTVAWLIVPLGSLVVAGVLALPSRARAVREASTLTLVETKTTAATTASADQAAAETFHRVGMNSCSARGCHGGVDKVEPELGKVFIKNGAWTTWINFDPHSRAYAVLLEPRSVAIAAHLKVALKGKPAHEAELCLSCHATTSPPEPEPVPGAVLSAKDGVSCESCHGPAEVWAGAHVSGSWAAKSADEKKKAGYRDLSTASGRASTCVGCHVGDRSRGMDMNHDLVAAGHPRLNFEYGSYLATYPKHWEEKPTASGDQELRSWVVGQLVTARATLRLTVDRALASKPGAKSVFPAPEAVWPEFAEYECFACHHDLVKQSARQLPDHTKGRLGKLPWSSWPLALVPELGKLGGSPLKLSPLVETMTGRYPEPDVVSQQAKDILSQLDGLIDDLEAGRIDPGKIKGVVTELASRKVDPRESWDMATQVYLSRLALIRAGVLSNDPAASPSYDQLKFPETPQLYDSPRTRDGSNR